jgi:hypothetical protein
MTQWLKQSTAVHIMFGPFVDKADGVTLETGAGIITSIDHATTGIFLSKNGGAAAIRHANVTASVLDAYGMFQVHLDTTDTDTLGSLDVLMAEAATFLPVWKQFMIVPANVWDSMFGADLLDTSVVQWTGTDVHAPGTAGVPLVDIHDQSTVLIDAIWDEATAGHVTAGTEGKAIVDMMAFGAPPAASAIADAVCDEVISTGHATANSLAKIIYDNVNAPIATVDTVVDTLTTNLADLHTDVGTAITNIGDVHATDLPAVMTMLTDIHNTDLPAVKADTAAILTDTGTTLDGAIAAIDTVVDAVKVVTDQVAGMLETDGAVKRYTANALELGPGGGSAPTAAEISDAVWGESTADHQAAGSAGKALTDAGAAGTPPTVGEIADAVMDEAIAGHTGAGTAGKLLSDTYTQAYNALIMATDNNAAIGALDTILDDLHGTDIPAIKADTAAILTDTGTTLDAAIAAVKSDTAAILTDTGTTLDGAITTIDGLVDAIKAKTDNLPASPAAVGSAMTLTAAYDKAKDDVLTPLAALDAIVDNLHDTDLPAVKTDTAAIKAKTDNLPGDPADESNILAAIAGVTGGGGISYEHTVHDDHAAPLANVEVWVTTDSAGANSVGVGSTNAFGKVVFQLDAGTYYVWKYLVGYTFTNPETITVS